MWLQSLNIVNYSVITLLFVWSLINLLYFLKQKSEGKWYIISFIMVILFQLLFYAMVLAEELNLYVRPYEDYFTILSYKRNLVFAILAVLVSSSHAHQSRNAITEYPEV